MVDLRSLSPVDFDTIEASVLKTGRLVVAHEAPVFCGLGAEIAARISERCFYHLESPVRRAGGFATPYPPSSLEQHYLPDADRILHEVDRCLAGASAPRRPAPVPPARPGGGLDRGRGGGLARGARRPGHPEPGPRRGRDGEGRRRAAQPVRGTCGRTARGGGRHRRGGRGPRQLRGVRDPRRGGRGNRARPARRGPAGRGRGAGPDARRRRTGQQDQPSQ